MTLTTAIEPVTILKTKGTRLISRVRKTRQPLVLTENGKAAAVLQDAETYREQQQALLLLKFLAQGDKELREGKGITHRQAKQHFQATLARLKAG